MLLFSVHPEPEGRKVDKMLTLKKVKEMVKAPAHTKRVPSPKVLLEEGRIFLRKEFEHGSHLTLYHNGYVWFSAGKRNTVFHIHDCRGDYAYGASKGKGEVIKEEYFENCEWHIKEDEKSLSFGDNRIAEAIERYHAKLLILDPMSSYIGENCSMQAALQSERRTMCGNPLCWHSFMQSRQSAAQNRRNHISGKVTIWNCK